MNVELKIELIRKFGNQLRAADALGIPACNISLILHGHRKPSAREREAFESALGKNVKKLLPAGK